MFRGISARCRWINEDPPEHERCTGFHVYFPNEICGCTCGHPHLKTGGSSDQTTTIPVPAWTPSPEDT